LVTGEEVEECRAAHWPLRLGRRTASGCEWAASGTGSSKATMDKPPGMRGPNRAAAESAPSGKEVLPDEVVQLQIVHVAAGTSLRRVHDDEHIVWVHMDSGNVATDLASGDRH
jgi:hypothetical protein